MNIFTYPYGNRAVVIGFCIATHDTLNLIKGDLRLNCELDALIQIQRYYYTVELRDPTVGELRIIDRVISARRSNPQSLILTTLTAKSDSFIGETYNDLCLKLSSPEVGAKSPFSFKELFDAGNYCLKAIGKQPGQVRMLSGRDSLLSASVSDYREVLLAVCGEERCALSAFRNFDNTQTPAGDNCLIFLTAYPDMSEDAFVASLAGLIQNTRAMFRVKSAALLGNGGLIPAVLSCCDGAYIDLFCLPNDSGFAPDLGLVLRDYENSAVAVVAPHQAQAFLIAASNYRLQARIIGSQTAVKRLTLAYGQDISASVGSEFLRTFKEQFCCPAVVFTQPSADIIPQSELSVRTPNGNFSSDNAVFLRDLAITATATKCLDYRSAVGTVVEAVSRLVACGVRYEEINTSFVARINGLTDEKLSGDSLALLLGIYRVQAELCLISDGSRCLSDKNTGLTVFAVGKPVTTPPPCRFVPESSRVYLTTIPQTDDGLPDFSGMRKLFGYVHGIVAEGEVLAIRAVGSDGVKATLERMTGEETVFLPSTDSEITGKAMFLVQTNRNIDGIWLGNIDISK